MKRIIAILAALTATSLANAGDTNWSWDGNTRIRHEMHSNPVGTETEGSLATKDYAFTEQKTTLGMNFSRGEKFKGKISLIHAFNWGDDGAANAAGEFNAAAGTAASASGHPNGIADQQNLLLVNEAWGWWGMSNSFSMAAGRGGITVADGKVISTNSDEVTPTAFEGLRLMYDHEMVGLTFYAIKVNDEDNGAGGGAGDFTNDPGTEFLGLSADIKGMPEVVKTLNVHVFQVNVDEVGATAGMNLMSIGVAAGGNIMGGLSYTANFETQSGDTTTNAVETDLSGTMMDFSVKYAMPEMMGFWVRAGYHSDTGNDTTTATEAEGYNPLFYDRAANSGVMQVIEWGNLTSMNLGVGFTAMDLAFAVNYMTFAETEEATGPNAGKNAGAFAGFANSATSDDIGTEMDLSVSGKCPVTDLNLSLIYSMFTPGDQFTAPNAETYSMMRLQAGMNF